MRSAHDCSEGGLAIALAEGCFAAPFGKALGARIRLDDHALLGGSSDDPIRDWLALLFGETPSRIILTVRPENVREVTAIAQEEGAPCILIGEVVENRLTIELAQDLLIDEPVSVLHERFLGSLPSILDGRREVAAD